MIKKILKRFLIGVFALIVIILSAGFIIGYVYQDEVENIVITELNKRLNTEINVSDVGFSIFSKFPSASIRLKDVVAGSPQGFNVKDFKDVNTDTLFSADDLYLEFNILDIINKNFTLKSMDVENGRLNVFIDRLGNDNLHFWKTDTGLNTGNFSIALKKLFFNKIYLSFYNASKDLRLRTFTNKLVLRGDFASSNYSLGTYGYFKIYEFYYDEVNYFKTNNVTLNLDLNVNNNSYQIRRGTMQVEDLIFSLTGNVILSESNTLNLAVKGKDLNIESFLSLLPEKYKSNVKDFKSTGQFYFDMDIKGETNYIKSPHIEASFGVQKGTIERKGSDILLEDVYLNGRYTNGPKNNSITSSLILDDFDLYMGGGEFSGNFRLENLKQPKIELIGKGRIDLALFQNFFKIDTIESLSGSLSTEFKFNGLISNLEKPTVDDFRNAKTEGKVSINHAALKLKDSYYNIENINGQFTFKNNDLKIDSLGLMINDNDLFIRGVFNNMISYILVADQNLSISGNISSGSLDIGKLLQLDDTSDDDSGYKFPDNIDVNANLDIDHFVFKKFVAESVKGKFKYKNKTLCGSPLTFSTMDGVLKSTFTIVQNDDKTFTTKVYASLISIDIKKLFYSFKNFDQDFIQDKHLNGNLTSEITYTSNWDNKFNVDHKSIVANGDIIIKNGQLVGFEPMKRLSKYIELEELMNVKFSQLENSIMIKNEKVIIPKMEINSTAFDIELSGEHYFDYRIDYRIKVLLSDILAKKAKKNKKENSEYGHIEDDGLGRTSLYLSITGTVDDYKVAYDTKNVITHIKEDLQDQKKDLKVILNEELGWFKKDSAVIQAKQEKEDKRIKNNGIEVHWDEEETDTSSVSNSNDDDDW